MTDETTPNSTAYALEDENGPIKPNQETALTSHRSHRCCGGCCDVRRAVVIVNSIQVFLLLFNIMGLGFLFHIKKNPNQYSDLDGNGVTDDQVTTLFNELNSLPWVLVWIQTMVSFCAALGGIYGAIQYKYVYVAICGVVYIANAIWSIIGLDISGFIYSLFFAYPHYFLVQEIRHGIMTKENYPEIENSCCCV